VPSSVFELFDEYAAAYARGERPSAEAYLDRAGAKRDQLARLLEEFLPRTPVKPPSEDDVRHLGLLLAEEPPLLTLRVERGLRVDDVVGALVDRLGLEAGLSEKLRLRYHELETGQLEPRRVDRRVWEALAEMLQAKVEELVAWARPLASPAPQAAYYRAADAVTPREPLMVGEPAEPDEVDRLFGVGG
jgi:hypothetical protein